MIAAIEAGEIEVGIGLTEGWIAHLGKKKSSSTSPQTQSTKSDEDGGGNGDGGIHDFKLVGTYVSSPLNWAISTGLDRNDIQDVEDLKGKRVGISRFGRCVFPFLASRTSIHLIFTPRVSPSTILNVEDYKFA